MNIKVEAPKKFKECNFCEKPPQKNKTLFIYKNPDGEWDKVAYCRKSCYNSYYSMNGGR